MLNGVNLMCDLGLYMFFGVDVVKRGSQLCLQLAWRRGNPYLLFSLSALTGSGVTRPSNSRIYIPET